MNVYEIVTNRIMELLEEGTVPWKKPWRSSEGPRNLISKKPYRGINSFLLNCSPYESDYYLTYNQAVQKGGQVRKGERSTVVIFWKWINTVREDDEPSNESKIIKRPLLRYYRVFNLEQVDGIEPPKEPEIESQFTEIEKAEQIIENMPLRPYIKYGGDRAYYSPSLDFVQIPDRDKFTTPEGYYDTLFHELSHSTGAISRLGRKGIVEPSYFGNHEYSAEELVAQFSSSMLLGYAGLEQQTIANSAAYISGWLKALKNDKKLATIAAGQAQKAADFILRKEREED